MRNSLPSKISALFLCADILEYPTSQIYSKLSQIKQLYPDFSYQEDTLEHLQSEYIKVFEMNSIAFKTVLNASWWIDGKMAGKSLSLIEDFYQKCGYAFDKNHQMADSLPYMVSFVAILAEDEMEDKIGEYVRFLNWLPSLEENLKLATNIKIYSQIISFIIDILHSFKENR
jgi:TorA maturation chaperone TorD